MNSHLQADLSWPSTLWHMLTCWTQSWTWFKIFGSALPDTELLDIASGLKRMAVHVRVCQIILFFHVCLREPGVTWIWLHKNVHSKKILLFLHPGYWPSFLSYMVTFFSLTPWICCTMLEWSPNRAKTYQMSDSHEGYKQAKERTDPLSRSILVHSSAQMRHSVCQICV